MMIPHPLYPNSLHRAGESGNRILRRSNLSFGPGIAREIIGQFLDALSGGQIAGSVLREQFAAQGLVVDAALQQQVQADYAEWFQSLPGERSWNLPLETAAEPRRGKVDHRSPHQPDGAGDGRNDDLLRLFHRRKHSPDRSSRSRKRARCRACFPRLHP
jgi:hypothetical protein